MSKMSTSELRSYQQICGKNGAMLVIACDQRGAMRSLLASDPQQQSAISEHELGLIKPTSPNTSPAKPPAYWSIRSAPCRNWWMTALLPAILPC